MKQDSKIERYDIKSRKNNRPLFLFALTERVSVFNRVLIGMNLQFKLTLLKMSTDRHKNNTVNGKILAISILRQVTNGSDLIQVGRGGTFRHIFTQKRKSKMNTNIAFVHEMTVAKS